MNRSVSVDLDLEPGTYSVLMKITAKRINGWKAPPEQVIRETCRDRQDKLIQIGLAYDLAHAKGQIKETEDEKRIRLEREAKKKVADHQKRREELRAELLKKWEVGKKRVAREKRHVKRKQEHDKKVEARKAATVKATQGTTLATAGKDATAAVDQAEKEDSRGTTETVKQDTPATTDGSPTEPNPEEPRLDDSKPGKSKPVSAEGPNNAKSGAIDEVTEKRDDVATINKGDTEDDAANPQSGIKTTAEEKAAQFEAALKDVPSVLISGATATATAPGTAPVAGTVPPPSTAADNDDWEFDSLASFSSSIVTDLDFPPSPSPEEEAGAPATTPANPDQEDENAEFENDPWNAVCVVGLRVYSKDEGLSVLIMRPKSEDEEDTPLDLDDNSKGASGETTKDGKEEVSTGDTAQDEAKAEIKEGAKLGST